jgi:hypothetical protein
MSASTGVPLLTALKNTFFNIGLFIIMGKKLTGVRLQEFLKVMLILWKQNTLKCICKQ